MRCGGRKRYIGEKPVIHELNEALDIFRERVVAGGFAALFLVMWMRPSLFGVNFVEGALASLFFEFFMLAAAVTWVFGMFVLHQRNRAMGCLSIGMAAFLIAVMGYGFSEEFQNIGFFLMAAIIAVRHFLAWRRADTEAGIQKLLQRPLYEISALLLMIMLLLGAPVPRFGLTPAFVAQFTDPEIPAHNMAAVGVAYFLLLSALPCQRFWRWLQSDPLK